MKGIPQNSTHTPGGSEHEERLATLIPAVVRGFDKHGQIGHGPDQVPQETVLAMARRLRLEDLSDERRVIHELGHGITAASMVLTPHAEFGSAMRDAFVAQTLVHVASLTAAGLLEEGAQVIRQALADVESGKAPAQSPLASLPGIAGAARRERQSQLQRAMLHQCMLLRDAQGVADALLARARLYEPKRPAWRDGFASQIDLMAKQGQGRDINFLLHAAAAMARHQVNDAHTPRERHIAWMRLATPLMTLAGREPGAATWNEARRAFTEARDACKAAGLLEDLPLLEASLAELEKNPPSRPEPTTRASNAPAPAQPSVMAPATPAPASRASKYVDAPDASAQPSSNPSPQHATGRPLSLADLARRAHALSSETPTPHRKSSNALLWASGGLALVGVVTWFVGFGGKVQPDTADKQPPFQAAKAPASISDQSQAAKPSQPRGPASATLPPTINGTAQASTAPASRPTDARAQKPEPYRDPLTSRALLPDEQIPPPGGYERTLDEPQIRWCLREQTRLLTIKPILKAGSRPEFTRFNLWVQDRDARCGNYEFYPSVMKRVSQGVEAERSDLVAQAHRDWATQPQGSLPEMALLDSDCKRGFWRIGFACEPVEIPANGRLAASGHDWECKRGYRAAGNECVKPGSPAPAQSEATSPAERERQADQAKARLKDEIAARLDALNRGWRSIEGSPGYFYYRAKNTAVGQGTWLDSSSTAEAVQALLQYAQWAAPGATMESLPSLSTDQLTRGRLKPTGLVTHVNRRVGFFVADFPGSPPSEVLLRNELFGTWHLLAAGKVEGTRASFTLPEQMQTAVLDERTKLYAKD